MCVWSQCTPTPGQEAVQHSTIRVTIPQIVGRACPKQARPHFFFSLMRRHSLRVLFVPSSAGRMLRMLGLRA